MSVSADLVLAGDAGDRDVLLLGGLCGGFFLVAAVAVAFTIRFLTRPPIILGGPPSNELRSEPPAVVARLVGRFEPNAEAVVGTFVDLAVRDILVIRDSDGEPYVRVAQQRPTGLLPFEQLVFEFVAERTTTGAVPVAQLRRHVHLVGC